MKNEFEFNYDKIPVLAIGFSRAGSLFGGLIRLFSGGIKAIADKAFANHSLAITQSRGQKFATEETVKGLFENSLEPYRIVKNRIVAMYYWTGFDDPEIRGAALDYLAYLRRKQGDCETKLGKYNFKGLFSKIPFIGKLKCFTPDPESEWCSENCASLMKRFGASFIDKTEIRPDELLEIMRNSPECKVVLGYYKY